MSLDLDWDSCREAVHQRSTVDVISGALELAGVEFIDENGGGPGVRLKKRQQKRKS
jgi:hypothetical protein